MSYTLQEWLNLAFRWTHVFAGIMWVGATYYFTWLDRRFHTSDPDEVWMVHSGGFYVVHKTNRPSESHTLHWFKWEAALTWLSGFPLLLLVYYYGGLLVDDRAKFTTAAMWGIGTIVIGWIVYDLLWMSRLPELLLILVSYAAVVALAWWLPHVMSNRAAYIHVGALLGTCMAANVWMRILPAQRKMVASARAGEEPDQVLADRAKNRSKHNTYMVIPVVMIMISNHFPTTTFGNDYNWIVLAVLALVGAAAAHVIRKH
ncbi:MAG TPA: urate hydroxylase PuuD [Thermoanaerobaculia bacterium]|nr:urate hydroxylase PuuD [Thermoanaerobaculia bacterium]